MQLRCLRIANSLPFLLLFFSASSFPEDGLPVTSELVRSACGPCHDTDDKGRMTRISYARKTPEGWQLTLKRMIRTNDLDLTPDQARQVVRYLSDNHGLAPEESRPYFYHAEKRPQREIIADQQIVDTCVRCHTGARFMTQRRTSEEWKLLKGMHIGYFPVIESQTFRGPSPLADPDAYDLDDIENKWRADVVLEKLASQFPFETPEWKAYRAKGSTREIEGQWLLKSREIGKGPITGIVVFSGSEGNYTYTAQINLSDGRTIEREGRGVLYGGFSWRGRSTGPVFGERREVMMLSSDGSQLSGRLFYGSYGELGVDISLKRIGTDPKIAAVWPRSAKTGSGEVNLTVYGANFTDEDLTFGQGVQVVNIRNRSKTILNVTVNVAEDALLGYRDVAAGLTQATNAFAIYDSVDYVKVIPEEALARVGGVGVPKQYMKFEAVAYHRGPDNESLTEDDIKLGVVQPDWSIEEYHIRHGDDDNKYVGTIGNNGLFTPAEDGPNPDRELNANNFGDVWIVASYKPDGAQSVVRGRALLVVSIPVFVYWDLLQ